VARRDPSLLEGLNRFDFALASDGALTARSTEEFDAGLQPLMQGWEQRSPPGSLRQSGTERAAAGSLRSIILSPSIFILPSRPAPASRLASSAAAYAGSLPSRKSLTRRRQRIAGLTLEALFDVEDFPASRISRKPHLLDMHVAGGFSAGFGGELKRHEKEGSLRLSLRSFVGAEREVEDSSLALAAMNPPITSRVGRSGVEVRRMVQSTPHLQMVTPWYQDAFVDCASPGRGSSGAGEVVSSVRHRCFSWRWTRRRTVPDKTSRHSC
jgi:hypothetical protein